jgi:hypothetical protein
MDSVIGVRSEQFCETRERGEVNPRRADEPARASAVHPTGEGVIFGKSV